MARYGQRMCEKRRWVPFAWIGESGGALRSVDPDYSRLLSAAEVNAACNTTIILARMCRVR